MLRHMRTTIRLSDDLAARAKELAARRGTTFTAVVEDALRLAFDRERETSRTVVELPTMGGHGLQAGVDLDDSAALLDLMEGSAATD